MENPKVIKKGDRVITNYVDEKTGKIAVYEVGIKLEVSDFSGQWFPAKIVEVDKGEKEVLVHFENWSARFDEWIKMDSNRLRPSPNTNIVKTQFKVGESVEALWNTDGQRYPGVIQNILPNDYYQVLFDDGIKLKKKYNQIFKLKPATRKGSASTPTTPGTSGGPSNSKASTEPVVPNPTLPELTPFSQFQSPAEQAQTSVPKVNSLLPPPPLIPKPKLKPLPKKSPRSNALPKPQKALDLLPSTSPPPPVPELPVVKKVQRRRRTAPPPTIPSTPPLQVLSETPPPVLSEPLPEISTPQDVTPSDPGSPGTALGSEEPLSSKRKRTVQDYSALLRIRRRFSYHKETVVGEPVVKRTRRNKSSPFPAPPELFPETPLLTSKIPPPPSSLQKDVSLDTPAAPESHDIVPQIPPSEQEGEGDLGTPVPSLVRPLKPKIKKRGVRPFNTVRRKRAKRKQPIKYIVVDDEEFAAAGGAANLNKLKPGSAPSTPGKEHSDEVDPVSAPPTPGSSEMPPGDPGIDGTVEPETRIIKRRRRRTYAHLQKIAAEAADSSIPTSSNGEEPLSKRKRTIHDYSMLLKTRPKFFFDIDAEQEKSPVRKRRSAERVGGESSTLLLPPCSSAAETSIGPVPDEVEPKGVSLIDPISGVGVVPAEIGKKSEPIPSWSSAGSGGGGGGGVGEGGTTSIATHRPIRRSSSQFARKSYVSPERVSDRRPQSNYLQAKDILTLAKEFRIVVPEPQILGSRLSEGGGLKGSVTLVLDHLDQDADYNPRSEYQSGRSSAGPSGGRRGSFKGSLGDWRKEAGGSTRSVDRKPQLGSRLSELDYVNNPDDDELLDIGYAPDKSKYAQPTTSSHVAQKPRKSPLTTSVPSFPSHHNPPPPISSLSAPAQAGPVKEVIRRKSRLNNNSRWWKRKPHGIRRVRISENGEGLPSPSSMDSSSIPRARKILQKIQRRPGDLLSGLTLRRIKTIRHNLYKQGFRKKIIAEPALKDVSVDIISCICGSADEHGLMVQCEYCQCWQHGQCFEIENVTDMPKNYVCEACLHPDNVRSRKPSDYHYDFHKVGKLPRFAFGPAQDPKTTKLLQETNALIQKVYQVHEIIQTSRVHMNLMEAKPDHPKLYQWDKPHPTIRETQQERKFNKVYRPLLRRLLYYNRDDPHYVNKLRTKIEAVVKKRSYEERQKAEKRLNDKFPAVIPSPKFIPPVFVRRAEPTYLKSSIKEDKEAKRLEAEALRIRKELETMLRPKPVLPVRSSSAQDVTKIKGKSEGEKVEVKPTLDKLRLKEVREVLEVLITKVDSICQAQGKIPQPTTATVKMEPHQSSAPVFVPVDLGEEAPPEFPDFPEPELVSAELASVQKQSTDSATLPPGITEQGPTCPEQGPVGAQPPGPVAVPDSKLGQGLNAVDLMHLDLSDPKFTTIAEDLVKSCCEEPESLIKTLEDLANGTAGAGGAEGVQDLEGNDSDLLDFLEDAFKDTFVVPPINNPSLTLSGFMDSKLMLPPPPPPRPIPSPSSFILPPAPPRLTRLTPELCRGNLILTILDQQRIIDQYLDEIETRVVELENMSGAEFTSRALAAQRISMLQDKVKTMKKSFDVMRSIGKRAEQSLEDLVRFDPSRLEDGVSGSEREEEELNNNEETDSVEEEGDGEDLSEEELEDL